MKKAKLLLAVIAGVMAATSCATPPPQLVEETFYFDNLSVLKQLGLA